MADSPRLSSLPSSSDTEPYVPLSWTAVAALGSAVIFALTLLVLAIDSFSRKRPLLEPELVVIFVAIVMMLSFVGRRAVRNSEGTTSGKAFGVDLCSAAWWTALVLGLSYAAYWLAIMLPLQREAQDQAQKWVATLNTGDLGSSFHHTLAPNSRRDVSPGDLPTMEARYRKEFINFRQSGLARLVLRNRGECRYEPASMRDTNFLPGQITSTITGTIVCPEGRFAIAVPMKATTRKLATTEDRENVVAGREWQILPDAEGYLTSGELTPYGWAISEILARGNETGRGFLNLQSQGPAARREAYVRFADLSDLQADTDLAPVAAVGGWGVLAEYPPAWLDRTSDRLFTLPGGVAPSTEQRDRFRRMWQSVGMLPPGTRLKDSKDIGDTLTVTDSGLELRIPVEIPIPGETGDPGVATARLVVVNTDPALLARLKELKAAAGKLSTEAPTNLNLPGGRWRVLRVESALQYIPLAPPSPPQKGG